MLYGIDVSAYQPKIAWPTVAQTNHFAVVKASEGARLLDGKRLQHLADARAARRPDGRRLRVGVYHFAHPDEPGSAGQQVDLLWKACGDTMPDFVVVDIEARHAGQSDADVLRFLEGFVAACESTFGRPPIIYTGRWFWGPLEAPVTMAVARCELWLAEYRSDLTRWPTGFGPFKVPCMWQFAGGVTVYGVANPCDRDAFNGDEDALDALCGLPVASGAK